MSPGPTDTGPAVLVGVQLPDVSAAELGASLDELARLAKTLGLRPVARLTQQRDAIGATVLGAGKLRELAEWTGGPGEVPLAALKRTSGARPETSEHADADSDLPAAEETPNARADVVIFDQDLTPRQLRNLEGATGARVLDRSSVILEIFRLHARSREARLQVEIARLSYMAPRLRATGRRGGDRQQGGIGGRGAGESALELDRRRVRDRIAELKQELVRLREEARTRRVRRVRTDTVALVGYTNAGKSSLMRALSGSDIHVADRLFATLDTTVRVLKPETRPRLLISDTVGFIRKLPHDLVASFRSTLEEAREAALLLHVVDAADPAWRPQLDVTRTVLAEIGAQETPVLLVFNKGDRLAGEERERLRDEWPEALVVSAFDGGDVTRLHGRIVSHFEEQMVEGDLVVPYRDQSMVHRIHQSCRVLSESHGEEGTRLRVLAPRLAPRSVPGRARFFTCTLREGFLVGGQRVLRAPGMSRRAFLKVAGLAAGATTLGMAGTRAAETPTARRIRRIVPAKPTLEGAGVRLQRAFGFGNTADFDPFLLLDDFRNDVPEHYLAGFPWHPHRGMETITYVLAGTVHHADSLGNRGELQAGDVQWMTAGSGILHQEMPTGDDAGRMHGFQLWANLPASLKMTDPRYQDIPAREIPEVTDDDGTRVRVICGEFWGRRGPVDGTAAEPRYLDVTVPPGLRKRLPVGASRQAFAYVFEGVGAFRDASEPKPVRTTDPGAGAGSHEAGNRSLVLFGDGDEVRLETRDEGVRFLMVSGQPIREPVAWRGPIVMNTDEELDRAYAELESGTFIKRR